MQKSLKKLFIFSVYAFFIIGIHYYVEVGNILPTMTFYFIYVLGGCSIINFFAGRIIQKLNGIKTFLGRIFYALLACCIVFFACYLLYNHFGHTWHLSTAFRPDTYTIVPLSTLGFLIGEIYQYKKEHLNK